MSNRPNRPYRGSRLEYPTSNSSRFSRYTGKVPNTNRLAETKRDGGNKCFSLFISRSSFLGQWIVGASTQWLTNFQSESIA